MEYLTPSSIIAGQMFVLFFLDFDLIQRKFQIFKNLIGSAKLSKMSIQAAGIFYKSSLHVISVCI